MLLTIISCFILTPPTPSFQFDPEGFGEIPVDDFIEALKSPEFLANVPPNKRDILYDRALKAKTSKAEAISFQDFVNVVSNQCLTLEIVSNALCVFCDQRTVVIKNTLHSESISSVPGTFGRRETEKHRTLCDRPTAGFDRAGSYKKINIRCRRRR